MENAEKNGNVAVPEISFALIYAFLRKNAKKIFWVGGCTFVFAFLVILIVYCFTPRVRSYRGTVSLSLNYKNGHYYYPSGKRFSNEDMISPPVLRKVYRSVGFEEKDVPFEEFVSSFYIAQSSMKKAFLDAQFTARMNVRNINVVQLGKLEEEYREAVATARSSQVVIAMSPKFSVNKALATRIINAVPQAWFDIYSVQEARHYPAPVPVQQIQGLAKDIGQEGQLILLEKCRLYCRQLLGMCSFLNEMLQGRNIMLPSGEMLGDLQNRLNMLERYQINILQMYVLEHPEFYGPFDRVFLESRVKNLDFELQRIKGKYEGVIAAMNALVADGTPRSVAQPLDGKTMAVEGGASAGIAPVTLQLDAGFFSSIAQLIRNDINSDLRRTLSDKTIAYRDEWADQEAEYKRYLEILDAVNGKRPSRSQVNIEKTKFYGLVREMLGELFTLSNKVKDFREMVLRDAHTSRQFSTMDSAVGVSSVPLFPVSRIALGILAVWVLLNAGYVFFLFQFRRED